MLSSLWSKLQVYALAGLSVLLAIVYALFRSEQAARAKEKLNGLKKAREVENKATDALVEGLNNEQKVKDAKVDTSSRSHFE